MFALAGFGHTFPVLVYIYERTEEELNEILYHTSTAAGTTLLHQSSGIVGDINMSGDFKNSPFISARGGGLRTRTPDMGGKEIEQIGLVNVRMTGLTDLY